jgi:hypothetical protein
MRFWNKAAGWFESVALWFLGLDSPAQIQEAAVALPVPADPQVPSEPEVLIKADDSALLIQGTIFCLACGCSQAHLPDELSLYVVPYHIPSDVTCSECGIRLCGSKLLSPGSEQDQQCMQSWLH